MIRFDGVHKYFDKQHALAGINLTITQGEMLFLTGHSGAGKSTLLKLLLGFEKPTQGRLYLDKRNLAQFSARRLAEHRRNIGTILQTPTFLPHHTVRDNAALPLSLVGMHPDDAMQRADTLLHKVGLASKAALKPAMLSAGEQQRLNIARAVISRPGIILADEPTGNLDPESAERILQLFKSFNDVGVTIIVATHDLGLIARLPYRIITLKQGRLLVAQPHG